jgi:DNA gyrase subunit A
MGEYGLTDKQAQAILEMRLQRLTGLERQRILEEHRKILDEIARLRKILEDESLLLSVVRQELIELKEEYGEGRRTEIVWDIEELDLIDYITMETAGARRLSGTFRSWT